MQRHHIMAHFAFVQRFLYCRFANSVISSITEWVSNNKVAAAAIVVGGGAAIYYLTRPSSSSEVAEIDENRVDLAEDDAVEPTPTSAPSDTARTEDDPAAEAMRFKGLGNTAFKAKKYAEAAELYTKAIELYPGEDSTCAVFYNNRGACLSHIKPVQHEKIIADTTMAIKMNPKYAKAYAKRASSHESLQDNRAALRDCTYPFPTDAA